MWCLVALKLQDNQSGKLIESALITQVYPSLDTLIHTAGVERIHITHATGEVNILQSLRIASLGGVLKAAAGAVTGSATVDDLLDGVTYKKSHEDFTTTLKSWLGQDVRTTASPTFDKIIANALILTRQPGKPIGTLGEGIFIDPIGDLCFNNASDQTIHLTLNGQHNLGGTAHASYSGVFNASTSWTLLNDIYYIDFVHNLGSTAVVLAVYDQAGVEVDASTISITSATTVRITVPAAPDNRFAGSIIIVRVDDIPNKGNLFTFNAALSWIHISGQYYVNIQHNLNATNIIVEVFDISGVLVMVGTKQRYDNNNFRLIIPDNPDLRFAGSANIVVVS